MPELGRQLAQQVLAAQFAPGLSDLMGQNFRKTEVLEQSDYVREGLVKRQHVVVRGFHEILVESIEQRMGRLVSDDIMGQTSKDHAAGELAGGPILGGRKVAKE